MVPSRKGGALFTRATMGIDGAFGDLVTLGIGG